MTTLDYAPPPLPDSWSDETPCEDGGSHTPTANEHADAWCSICGERLLIPGYAGGPHVGHYSRLGGTYWCDTCNSPYCELA